MTARLLQWWSASLGRKGLSEVDAHIVQICYPVILLGELPDKTTFGR